MFNVFIISKSTRRKVKNIAENVSEIEALRICEMWGWNYSNENGESFYMDYEEN